MHMKLNQDEPIYNDLKNYLLLKNDEFGKLEITSLEFLDWIFRQTYPTKKNIDRNSRQYFHIKLNCNYLLNLKDSPYDYIGVHRSFEFYNASTLKNEKNAMKKHIMSFAMQMKVLDSLIALGLVQQKIGYFDSKKCEGNISKIKPTVQFFDLLESYPESYSLKTKTVKEAKEAKEAKEVQKVGKKLPPVEERFNCKIKYIVMKNKDKEIVKPPNSLLAREINSNLSKYNRLLAKSTIEHKKLNVDCGEKLVKRVFNDNSLSRGGRYFYGFWERISKQTRSGILINGNETVELDFKALHFILLYGIIGIDYFEEIGTDPYDIKGLEKYRAFTKKLLLICLNAKDRKNALSALTHAINKNNAAPIDKKIAIPECYKKSEILDLISNQHQQVAHLFYSNIGKDLQNRESALASMIINHFTSKGVVVLSVHDSFIIDKKHQDELADVMIKFTKELYNVTAIVEKTL